MRLLVVFGVVLTGAIVAFAQEDVGNFGEGGSTEAAKSQAAPPPNPYPCHFGPITKRITQGDVSDIILDSPTLRAAWYAILARPEDEGAEPYGFILRVPDDGLGDGLVCPESP